MHFTEEGAQGLGTDIKTRGIQGKNGMLYCPCQITPCIVSFIWFFSLLGRLGLCYKDSAWPIVCAGLLSQSRVGV